MSDLRRLAQPLLDHPPLEPTPVGELARRSRRHRRRRLGLSAGVLIVVGASVGGLVITRDRHLPSTVRTGDHVRGPVDVSTLELGGATDAAIGPNAVWVPGLDVVRRVDPVANAVTATIPVPGSSDYRSVTVAFGSVWVTDTGTGTVTRIDGTTNRVLASIRLVGSPTRMAAAGGSLWVLVPDPNEPGGAIVPIDPVTNQPSDPLPIPATEPAPFAQLTSIHDILFTAWGNRLMRIDPTTRAVAYVPGFGVADATRPVDVTNDGRDLFVLTTAGIRELDSTGRRVRESNTALSSARAIAVAGGSVWVLTQPSSTASSLLQQFDAASLQRVGRPLEVGQTATGVAADAETAWVPSEGNATRVDLRPQIRRPELCPGNARWDRWGADGLPPVAQAVTDLTSANRALDAERSTLLHEYTGAVSVTVGAGYGRAWSRDAAGRVTVVAVDDYALIVHLRSKRDCPTGATMPVGNATSDNIPVLLARDGDASPTSRARSDPGLKRPEAMAVDRSGRPLIWNQGTHQILRLTTDNRLEVVAGNGERGARGDGGTARSAELGDLGALAVSSDGTILFADGEHHRIRAIAPDGTIRTVAGNGSAESSGDGGPAAEAGVPYPSAIAVGPDGRWWITDSSGLRYISANGTMHPFLPFGADKLVLDDGTSMLFGPDAVAIDTSGDLWVYNLSPKVLVKFAPNGTVISHWDLYVAPAGLAAIPGGGVAIADYGGFAVERITGTTLTTLVMPNPTAELRGFRPSGVAVGPDGTVYASADGVSGGNRFPAIVSVDAQGLHQLR